MFRRKNKNIRKLPGAKSIKKRYTKENIEFFNSIEVRDNKKGINIIGLILVLLIIAGILGGVGSLFINQTDNFFQSTFYPEGAGKNNAPPPTAKVQNSLPSQSIQ